MVGEINQGVGLLELVQFIDSLLCCFSVGNVPENVLPSQINNKCYKVKKSVNCGTDTA